MTGSRTWLLPVDPSDAVELSTTLWRKQILPKGAIRYKGQTLTFDDKFFAELSRAFKGNALGQVPFVFADKDNAHTMDPERLRGEVKGLIETPTGLDALLELSEEAAKVVRDSGGKLGVSCKIDQNRETTDGSTVPLALVHVMGTMDPKVVGMGAWQEVKLSNDGATSVTIDLTTSPFVDVEPPVQHDDTLDEASEEEIESALAELYKGWSGRREEVKLSRETQEAIELVRQESARELRTVKLQLAQTRFEKEQLELISAGVPPRMVELAREILTEPNLAPIELSTGRRTDPATIIRSILNEAKGFVELARERGSSFDVSAGEDHEQAILDAWTEVH
jgi:hypothetical protein